MQSAIYTDTSAMWYSLSGRVIKIPPLASGWDSHLPVIQPHERSQGHRVWPWHDLDISTTTPLHSPLLLLLLGCGECLSSGAIPARVMSSPVVAGKGGWEVSVALPCEYPWKPMGSRPVWERASTGDMQQTTHYIHLNHYRIRITSSQSRVELRPQALVLGWADFSNLWKVGSGMVRMGKTGRSSASLVGHLQILKPILRLDDFWDDPLCQTG